LVCVLPKDHDLACKDVIALADLEGYPLISFRRDTPHGALITSAYKEAKVERSVTTYVRFAETACSLVKSGLGVAIVDGYTAMGEIRDGLVMKPITPSRSINIYAHRNKFGSRSKFSKIFEQQLKEFLKQNT